MNSMRTPASATPRLPLRSLSCASSSSHPSALKNDPAVSFIICRPAQTGRVSKDVKRYGEWGRGGGSQEEPTLLTEVGSFQVLH